MVAFICSFRCLHIIPDVWTGCWWEIAPLCCSGCLWLLTVGQIDVSGWAALPPNSQHFHGSTRSDGHTCFKRSGTQAFSSPGLGSCLMLSSLSSTSAYTLTIDWTIWASVQPAGQWAPSNQRTPTSSFAFGLGTDGTPQIIFAPATAECLVPLWLRSEKSFWRIIQVPKMLLQVTKLFIWLSVHSLCQNPVKQCGLCCSSMPDDSVPEHLLALG